jgi:hypothetical protein
LRNLQGRARLWLLTAESCHASRGFRRADRGLLRKCACGARPTAQIIVACHQPGRDRVWVCWRSLGSVDTVAGETNSVVIGLFLSAEISFGEAGGGAFGGAAQASYLSQTQDAYTESGSSTQRLDLPEMTFETMGLEAARKAGTSFDLGGADARIQFNVGLQNTAARNDRIIPMKFGASSASVDLQGDTRDHTSPFAAASFEWLLGASTSLTTGYHGRFGDDERHEVRIGMQVGF